MNTVFRNFFFLLVVGVAFLSGAPVQAQEASTSLRIGLSAEPTAVDPHFQNLSPNRQISSHIFEALISIGPDYSVRPGLAESHRLVNNTTWEFRLRKDVKFHDGTALDANDVIFSICRVPKVVNSPSPFTRSVQDISDVIAKDPYTLVIKTKTPFPLLPRELASVFIISDSLIAGEKVTFALGDGCKISAAWPKTEDFNSGKNTIGTGPFKFGEYVKGDRLILTRNDAYWGKKAEWREVRFRPITSPGPRVAALLSGDVDFIEDPPVQDLLRLQSSSKHKTVNIMSPRLIYIAMDQRNDTAAPPGVQGTDGKNPFLDERVRKALSLAVDRDAIANRVMLTFARPAEQLMPKGYFGSDPAQPALRYDADAAKQLLAEAGYPNGFEVTLAAPNDRYVNDAQIAQAIAQMWTRIGIKTNVNVMTSSVFFPKRTKNEFGVWLAGWGSVTGEISSPLRALVATPNKEKGWGIANNGKFSDAALDQLIDKAIVEMDDGKRQALFQQAGRRAMDKMGVIPIHYEFTPWAMRRDLDYTARGDQQTLAFDIVLDKNQSAKNQ